MPTLRRVVGAPLLVFCFVLAVAWPVHAVAPDDEEETRFLRIENGEDGDPRALQVSVVTYVGKTGGRSVSVDLISAIHIGDKSYYQDLNNRFRQYDALLYELIADEETRNPPEGAEATGVISNTQVMMKNVLDLTFQLDEIDYTRDNFVHADFSPEELSDDMERRGESVYAYFWRLFFVAFSEAAKDPLGINELYRFSRAASAESDSTLKVAFAYEFAAQTHMGDFLGGENGSAIIEGRNQRVMDVLDEQIRSGARRIGIFYGAGHMPDLEERLATQMELTAERIVWIDAWNLD